MLSEEQSNGLAKAVQGGFPLVEDPFAELAERLDISPEAVLAQLRQWHSEGKLREVSAVLEGSTLGWDSALVAGTVPEERIEAVAAVVSAHPTVTHNYRREHAFNLWFTIAVPPEMSLDRSLELLAEEAGVPRFFPMRRTRTFKIGVNFDLKTRTSSTKAEALQEKAQVDLSAAEKLMMRALQTPLPFMSDPFAELAELAGTSRDQLLAFATKHHGGAIRRYVGTFRHRRLGVRGNGMAVWAIPEADQERLGLLLAGAPEVTHCYARDSIAGFPFTTYSMIHGPDRDAVKVTAARLSAEIGIDDYLVLFSTQEFKKQRLRYFLPELDEWWNARSALEGAAS
jgi:siroheme decarboxylase